MSDTLNKRTDTERMLNLPDVVETKKFGKDGLKVREPYLEQVIGLAGEIMQILQSVYGNLKGQDEKTLFFALLKQPETTTALKKVIAACSNKSEQDFNDVIVSDWLKIFAKLKRVIDWGEMKTLFFEIISPEVLQKLREGLLKEEKESPENNLGQNTDQLQV